MKPGYKQTEVGVIPVEWDALAAREIGVFRGGNGFPLEAQGARSGDYPFFKVSDMNNEGNETFMTTANHWISEHTRKSLGATAFPADAIVFAKVGAAIFLERKKILGQASCIDNNMAALVLDRSRADVRFVHTQLLSKKLGSLVATTALPALNGKQLDAMALALPPLPEQRAIATALSDVDGLLGGLDRLIAKKRDLKQAAMQQLLTGQTRLPGFHGEWEVKRLGDVASVSKGNQLHSSETDDGGKFAHLNGGITPSSYTHKSNTDGNTIAISEGGNSCGFVQFMTEPYWCGGHCYSVIPNGVDNLFLYHALKGQQSAIMGLRVGSGLPNVQKTSLLDFKIELPATLPEQTAIATVLTELDGELAVLEQRREKTRALKQAMMQELLTGQTRLV